MEQLVWALLAIGCVVLIFRVFGVFKKQKESKKAVERLSLYMEEVNRQRNVK